MRNADTTRSPRSRPIHNDPCPIDSETLTDGIKELNRIAVALEDLLPAARAIEELNTAQDKLCGWLKRWGPWVLGLLPFLLSAAGAMTPETAMKLITAITAATGG